jgi:hypothetical protein
MKGRLLFPLGRGLLALAFIGPGGMHLLEGWREQQMSASTAVALLEVGAGFAVLLGWQVRWIALALAVFLVAARREPAAIQSGASGSRCGQNAASRERVVDHERPR